MTSVVQTAIDALALGGLYALLALGIALVFSVMNLINFAYGELLTLGGYLLLLLGGYSPWLLVAGIVVVAAGLASMSMERVAFRPLRDSDPTTLLVSSFAVSFLLQSLALSTIGSRPRGIELPEVFSESITIGDIVVANVDLMTIAAAITLLIGVGLFLKRSPVGLEMRAAAEDFDTARLLGVNANRVILYAFGISGLLAGVSSLLVMGKLGVVASDSGLQLALIAFVAVVVGGMGGLVGPVVGGFALGVAAVVLQTTLPPDLAEFRDAFMFGLVILVLLLRPQGLIPGPDTGARV